MSNFSLTAFPRKHLLKIIIIFTSIAIFSIAFFLRNNALQELSAEKSILQQQQIMNNTGDDSTRLLARYLHQYRLLQQQGVIGDPKRLQWLESVQANADKIRIPKLNFILSATELTTDTHPLYHHPELETKSTLMQLTFALLHEGDLYHLLEGLQQKAQGVFNIEECEISRSGDIPDSADNQKLEGRFTGNCYLRWYSIADLTQSWEVSAQ